jgi:hypothetical protein
MKYLKVLPALLVMFVLVSVVQAQTTERMTEETYNYSHDENMPRGVQDDAPSSGDWGTGSWQGPATGKSNDHIWYSDEMTTLFGEDHGLKVSDLSTISYWTKTSDTSENWWLSIYTKLEDDNNSGDFDAGDDNSGSWYDSRLHARPDGATADTWEKWSTDSDGASTNQLQFYDSVRSNSGDVTTLSDLASTGDANYSNVNHDYSAEELKSITLQTDSGWTDVKGQIDGLTIELGDGSVGEVNFEPGAVMESTEADSSVSMEFGIAGLEYGAGAHGTEGLEGGTPLDKGLKVSSLDTGSAEYVTLKMFYDEEEIDAKGIQEDNLRMWWWNSAANEGAGEWVLGGTTELGEEGESTFAGVGTSPDGDFGLGYTGLNIDENYTWVNANHASDYIQATPEPGGAVLLAIGLLGLCLGGRRRRNG